MAYTEGITPQTHSLRFSAAVTEAINSPLGGDSYSHFLPAALACGIRRAAHRDLRRTQRIELLKDVWGATHQKVEDLRLRVGA